MKSCASARDKNYCADALSAHAPANRFIITCRILSYVEKTVLPSFTRIELAPFDGKQITEFISRWYQALQQLGKPEDWAKDKTADLQQAVQKLPPSMVRNPLLLTTLAGITPPMSSCRASASNFINWPARGAAWPRRSVAQRRPRIRSAGSRRTKSKSRPFQISEYPITNAQFEKFMQADSYENKGWWSAKGWKYRQGKNWKQPRYWRDEENNLPNQPVVGVSWFEVIKRSE